MLFEAIVAGVKSEGGLDVSDAIAGGWVNEAYKEVVADSKWMMAVESLATTVAAQAAYTLPENIADVVAVTIDTGDGSGPGDWQPKALTDLWALKRGARRLRGSGGVFASTATSAGVKQVELYPAPTTTGLNITALVALIPNDLVNGDSPAIPVDMHGRLKDAAIALGMLRNENRPDLAAGFEARKTELVGKLQRRANSRMGSEPTRIQIEGVDF
jgi:hypothetical protein